MNKRVTAGFAALLISLVATGCSVEALIEGSEEVAPSPTILQADEPPPPSETAEIVEQALPSLVNVRTKQTNTDLFGETSESSAQGSGVVIDRNGIILTNNHVVAGTVKVTVVFNDDHGRMEGEVIGLAPERDLAVIRVDADDLVPVEIGRSSQLRLGDDVIALGFPLGLGGPTVTKGIISGLERTIRVPREDGTVEALEGLLQTDAAINPGNSGGPLLDAAGRLVGINTAAVQAGAGENVGFAISIDQALPVIEEILSPRDQSGYLGVSVQSVDSSGVAAQLGVDPDVRGAVIMDLLSGGPAEDAGLGVGEVIVAVGGMRVDSAEGLTEALMQLEPGDLVDVDVVSADGERSVEVELGRRPSILGG